MTRLFAGTPWDRPPTCDRCGLVESECRCPPPSLPPRPLKAPQSQTARLAEEKRPGNRWVTVVRGLASVDNDLPSLVTQLKQACGAGGSHVDEQIELQGRHTVAVRRLLEGLGYKVRGT